MNQREIEALEQAVRQLISVQSRNTAALMASMPQFFTMNELTQRYKLGKDTLRTLLVEHRMIRPSRGHSIRVSLENVLLLDRILKGLASEQ